MAELWFWLIAVMAAIYSVMDGFDFGGGVLHLFVAKSDGERRMVLGAIGPYWDGNEVWLLAVGGAMFLAFPRVLASGFSGFYMAMFLVVWTLILRGISIEFRSHVGDELWRNFWDRAFALASLLMPILLGAALGNVIRGVPLDKPGDFSITLFTDFHTSNPVGILDWFTVLIGVFVLITVTAHGSLYLAWKTDGAVHERCRAVAKPLWGTVVGLWIVSTLATRAVSPEIFQHFLSAPLAWLFFLVYLGGLVTVFMGISRKNDLLAFFGSGAFILGILATTAACVFPVILKSSLNPDWSLTIANSRAGEGSLRIGLVWWLTAVPLAIGYFLLLFKIHKGKIKVSGEGY